MTQQFQHQEKTDAEIQNILQRLGSRKEKERLAAERELFDLGPQATEPLLAYLKGLTRRRKQLPWLMVGGFMIGIFMIALISVLMKKLLGIDVSPGVYSWIVVSFGISIYTAFKSSLNAAMRVLAEVEDVRAVGPLAEALTYAETGKTYTSVSEALIRLLQTILFLMPIESLPCLKDMLTDGADGTPDTPFLKALNTKTKGPDYATAHYFSLAGDNYESYDPIVGPTVHDLYILADLFRPADWVEDGLVAVYSAQSPALGRQSETWQAGPTLDINHHAFVTGPVAFEAVQQIVATW